LSLLATLVFGLSFAAPAGAQTAGPYFEDSGPDQGDFEHEAPREIFIQFSETLGPSSSAQVYDGCGRRLEDGADDIRGDTLWAQLVLRPAGRYLVVYSASGEGPEAGTTEGSFTFRVHFGPSCGEGPDVSLQDSGFSDLASPPGSEIAPTALALCIARGLFGGFALRGR
jgi:methionine-rich copper-binding protein CopC